MGGVNGGFLDECVRVLDESVRVTWPVFEGGSAAAAAEIRKLERPWIADEGPLAARFRRHPGGEPELEARGLAFDERVTVQWDEEAVWVIEPRPSEDGVFAREVEVLVRERFRGEAASVRRVDYLRGGVLLASRYLPAAPEGGSDA